MINARLCEKADCLSLREKVILTFNIVRPRPQSVLNASTRCRDSKMFRSHL